MPRHAMSHVYVVPKPGLQIVDPAVVRTPARFLPPEGRLVELSHYWTRRIADADVTVGVDPSAAPANPPRKANSNNIPQERRS